MGVATDAQPVAQLDDLNQGHHQVTDERFPAGSLGSKASLRIDAEPSPIQDRPRRRRPAYGRVEQASHHPADLVEGSELAWGDVLRRQRHPMVGQVLHGLGRAREMVMIALVVTDAGEPMASWSMTGVRDPEKIAQGSPWPEADDAGVARTNAAQWTLRGLPWTMTACMTRR